VFSESKEFMSPTASGEGNPDILTALIAAVTRTGTTRKRTRKTGSKVERPTALFIQLTITH
jgi:hypothetical protein